MENVKKPFRLNAITLILIAGLIAFLLYIYFYINPVEVYDILSKTNLEYYVFAFVSYFLFAFFSSLVWHRLLSNLSIIVSKRQVLLFTWAGLFFDATIPQLGWSGEVSKTYLLGRDSTIDVGKIGASVVGQKLFTMTMTIIALSLGLGLVFWTLFYFQGSVCFDNWIDIKIGRNKLDIQVIYYKNVIHMRSFIYKFDKCVQVKNKFLNNCQKLRR